jgi:anti-sigma regulatory factor (Ser/Thr protein kinase)
MAPTRPIMLHQPTRPTGPTGPSAPQKPLRPTALQKRRVTLAAEPASAGAARSQVQATIQAWEIPVEASIAVLLTSELVTNAIRHEKGDTLTLAITCAYGQLHVDVHDTSCMLPVPMDGPPDAETGRGLVLVASLSSSWGYYRTTTGKAVYFTLAFQDGRAEEAGSSGG